MAETRIQRVRREEARTWRAVLCIFAAYMVFKWLT